MSFWSLCGVTALALAGGFAVLWLASLWKRDASIVDAWWGPAFAAVAWLGAALGAADGPRPWLVAGLVTAWALRLGLHLGLRNHGKEEDHRYAAMRRHHGARFWLVSLFTVFLLQAALVLVISAPLQLIATVNGDPTLGPLDWLGAGLLLLGLCVEAVADLQLTRFRRDPASRGQVLDTGLWRFSRHPNYFGDAVVWWGVGLLCLGAGAWAGLLGPALMTFLLLRVSGVTLLEQTIEERRPAYAGYIARTSAFVLWPPRSK